MSVGPLEKIPREETLRLRKTYIGKSCTLFFEEDPLKIVRGEGQYMFDENGKRYLDCINNVAHVGHSHPRVTRAAAEQMGLLCTNSRYLHDNIVLYAQKLVSTFPAKLNVCFFVNSGSEANDLALRMARAHTGHEDVIVLEGAYHGNLSTSTDMSPMKFEKISGGKKDYVHVAALPCSYRGLYTMDEFGSDEVVGVKYAENVQNVINKAEAKGRKISAFYAESMVSCGGQVLLPKNYLSKVYQCVRNAGGVCVADEVQTGFGRVGTHMWAFQMQGEDLCPDIVTIGKPMGNGHPVSAVVTTKEIASSFKRVGGYFNTYGGNPVSMAIANAVLSIIEDEDLLSKADRVGRRLLNGLHDLQGKHPLIGDVRGVGLFLGIDLVKNRITKEPATEEAAYVIAKMKDDCVLLSAEGKYNNVLKIKPPMVFDEQNADMLVERLHTVLSEMEKRRQKVGYESWLSASGSTDCTSSDDDMASASSS